MSMKIILWFGILASLILCNLASATYVYDSLENLNLLYYYNSSGATFTSLAKSNIDLFPDDATEGDYLAFGVVTPSIAWHDLHFNLETPANGTNFTVVWEYMSDYSWITLPNVTDGCNNFNVTGECNVTFPVPDKMRYTSGNWYIDLIGSSASRGVYIRARIINATGITEGGRQGNFIIKNKDNIIKITNEIAVTMASIYSQDIANNWGVVNRLSTQTYQVDANVYFVNSDFTTVHEMIEIGTKDRNALLWNDAVSTFQMGALDSSGYGEDGSMMIHNTLFNYAGYMPVNNARLYASILDRPQGSYSVNSFYNEATFVDSVLSSAVTFYFPSGVTSGEFTRSVWDVSSSVYLYNDKMSLDAVKLNSASSGFLCGAGTPLVSNTNMNGKTLMNYYGADTTLIDSPNLLIPTKVTFNSPSGTERRVYYKFNLDIKVQDVNNTPLQNVNVTIFDTDGTKVLTNFTYANGSTDKNAIEIDRLWVLLSESYSIKHHKSYNNFTIKLSKDGYKNLEFNFTLLKKEDLYFTLETQPVWNYSTIPLWKIRNSTLTTILKLDPQGNLAIAGKLYEFTNSPPPLDNILWTISNNIWLNEGGDLYIKGERKYN